MRKIQLNSSNAIRFIEYSLPLLIIGIVSRTFPIFNFFYYLVPVILLIYILLALYFKLYQQISLYLILIIFSFPFYCLITEMWSLNPKITFERSGYLIFIYAGILSAILLYKKILPEKGIEFLIPANILVIVISLFSLITNSPSNSWSGGNGLGFMGFAGHQNTLAAAILFTLPGVFTLRTERPAHSAKCSDKSGFSLRSNIVQSAKSRFFRLSSYFLLLTFNFLLLLLTYSRAAILALVIGTITYLIITKSKKILAILFSSTALLFVLYFTVSPLQSSIDSVLNKDGGKILGRRMILWEPSFEAAKLGGVFGLGYGVSAPDIKTPILTGSHYENGRYIREKGNSFLAIIEETGLTGLILFLLPMIWIIRKFIIYNSQFTIKENFRSNSTLYTCLPVGKVVQCSLLAMFVHSQFEAWWVGVGSVALPIFLVILIMLFISDNNNDVISNYRERSYKDFSFQPK